MPCVGANCCCSSSSTKSCPCFSVAEAAGKLYGALDEPPTTPTPSHSHSIMKLENKSPCDGSSSWDSNNVIGHCSIVPIPTVDDASTPKSSAELREEIAALEDEILHLERYLLSLYRTAFEDCISIVSDIPTKEMLDKIGLPSPALTSRSFCSLKQHVKRSLFLHPNQSSPSCGCGWANSENRRTISLQSTSTREHKAADSGCRCLVDHLSASSLLEDANTPDRLSEDIIRCISSIYCRLANPVSSHLDSFSSPASSLSASSLFSSHNPCNNSSSHCSEDTKVHHQLRGLKEECGPYLEMVEVLKICLDNDSFNYAAVMLKHFRSLVRNLEKVDPGKMKREQKLAFWINIHNALVMHAYLAYGTDNGVRSASFSKAAYNIGGCCINARTIQNSIFGIRSHYSEPWLQTLFSPGRKSKMGSIRHAYALEYPEPLVHFALCSGAYSDPVVRVYTSNNVFQELKLAREEFIQASVYIQKETNIFLPKVLSYFAKDMSMDLAGLLQVIGNCVTEVQRKAIRKCLKRKPVKCIRWLAQSSSFRYLIHGELAKGRLIV